MSKRKAIIVDIDGTLADARHRLHLIENPEGKVDWPAWDALCHKDTPFAWCVDLVTAMHKAGCTVLFVTGRGERIKTQTKDWLDANLPPYVTSTSVMFMRKNHDYRPDTVIKAEYYKNEIDPRYEVLFVLEDRDSVVEMYRGLGLTVLHCDHWSADREKASQNLTDPKHKGANG